MHPEKKDSLVRRGRGKIEHVVDTCSSIRIMGEFERPLQTRIRSSSPMFHRCKDRNRPCLVSVADNIGITGVQTGEDGVMMSRGLSRKAAHVLNFHVLLYRCT